MSAKTGSRLLAADSFRVRVNPRTGVVEARGLEEHLERFRWSAFEAWCGRHRPSLRERSLRAAAMRALRAEVAAGQSSAYFGWTEPFYSPAETRALAAIDEFLEGVPERIAGFGEGWPRLELWRDGGSALRSGRPRLELALRELPELQTELELRTAGRLSRELRGRRHPARKGPNIARYSALNRRLGAEAILTDLRGRVVEGATTSFLWWPRKLDGPEPWGSVSASDRRVPSVTESILAQAGGRRLVGTKPHRRRIGQPQPRWVTPAELQGVEVWAVNALHGIRAVTSIDGVPQPAPRSRRLRWFREALDRAWESVLAEPAQGADPI